LFAVERRRLSSVFTTAASSRTVLTFLEANPEIKVDVVEKDFTKGELQ
jgi:hypothetical protein